MTEGKNISDLLTKLSQGRVSSADLFFDRKEIIIEHDDQEYRLRITANDKLILTK